MTNDKEFDIHIHPIITRKQTNKVKNSDKDYLVLSSDKVFDFVDLHNNLYYGMDILIIRIEIVPGKYECIATNLDDIQFSKTIIKKLYFKRCGIETSFRELKYNLCLVNLHSKKIESIYKEIYAKITMFNYCMAIIDAIVIINEIRYMFTKQILHLLQSNTLSMRDNQSFKRNVHPTCVVCFQYRVA